MTESAERHPDIEIYVANASLQQIQDWLSARFGQTLTRSHKKGQSQLEVTIDGTSTPVLVIEKAAGRFTSLWFDSATTPWHTDLDCAREAQLHFNCEIRCIYSGWNEGDDPDEWWSINNNGEQRIQWRSS